MVDGQPPWNDAGPTHRTYRRRIGADRHKTGLSQRYLPGHKGQVEAEGHDDIDTGNRDNGKQIVQIKIPF